MDMKYQIKIVVANFALSWAIFTKSGLYSNKTILASDNIEI